MKTNPFSVIFLFRHRDRDDDNDREQGNRASRVLFESLVALLMKTLRDSAMMSSRSTTKIMRMLPLSSATLNF